MANAGTWYPGTILTDPTNGAILVDSGPVEGGYYLVGVVGSASVPLVYDLQRRNAANSVTVQSQRRRFGGDPNENDDMLFPNKIPLQQNERMRCVLVGAITGEVQLSLFLQGAT
jgi:hypothetical protein